MWTENVKFTDFSEHFESSINSPIRTLEHHLWPGAFTIHTLMALPGGTFWVQCVFPVDTLTY